MMQRLVKLAMLAVLLGVFLALNGADRAYAANLVGNSGFESGLWTGGGGAGFSIDSTVYHSGGKSLKVSGAAAARAITSEKIHVRPYEGYQLEVWVRSSLSDSKSAISVSLLPVDAADHALAWYPGGQVKFIQAGGGRQNWTKYTATIHDLPASTDTVKIYLRLDAGAVGDVWFDDVSLESINLAPDGGFESGLWSHNTGFIRDTAQAHSGLAAAKVTGQSEVQAIYTDTIPIVSSETYTLSVWVKTDQISTGNGISVGVLQVNAANQALGWYGGSVKLMTAGGTQGWTKLETELSGFAANTSSLRIYLRSDGGITGTSWFDDVRLNKKFRDGFIWGVNGHSKKQGSYPASQLDNQLQKAADLGISHYRVDVEPSLAANGSYDWTYMDQVINTAYNKGLKIYLVIYAKLTFTPAVLEQYGQDIAARYKGKIAYYQIGNEIDNDCILGSQYDGSQASHYNRAVYEAMRDKLIALGRGVRTGDPDAKRVINMCYRHTAFLEMLLADGVEWEVNGLDWYSNMGDMTFTLNKLQSYPQPEILVAECNTFQGTLTWTEQAQAEYIVKTANQFYYNAPSKVKGFFVYELLDEPDRSSGEQHYGLVHSSGGIIGAEKPAYGAYQAVIANKPRD